VVRRDSPEWGSPSRDGLQIVAAFPDAEIFAVTATMPALYTAVMTGFFPRERNAEWSWRWMGADASWIIVNTSREPVIAALYAELSAFNRPRRIDLRLDGGAAQSLAIDQGRRIYRIGPVTLPPGSHELRFRAAGPVLIAGDIINNGDRRALSIAVGAWSWILERRP
jgi:hypothetical protein